MEWSLTQNKLLAYHRLMRTDKPIGALLLLWPTLWALWVATPGVPPLWILAVFVAGVWLMRAAGCVVNDYADRKFDGHVKRTANRPLPSGQVTGKEARILFVVLVLLSFMLVLTLNTMTILLSVAALALAWVYPFMKRYTHLPQVVLGAAFGWSIPMAFAAVSESVPLSCWLMFLANILWAVAYDTQYAMVDRDDDLKIGIKSTAILFGRHDKLIIGILQVAVLALMVAIGRLNGLNWEFYWSVLVAGLLFAYQQKLIAKREREACFKAFLNNNYVGLVLFLGLAMSYPALASLALRRTLNRQTHIRGNQLCQHLINLHRLFRLGIARIANVPFVAQRQHQGAEYRFVEEFRGVNAMQNGKALGQRPALFFQRTAVD